MKKEDIIRLFNDFKASYDEETADNIWSEHNKVFNYYWKDKILSDNVRDLNEAELDQVIRNV